MPLITAAQFREHFPALVGTDEDTLLGTLIDRADAAMAAWCGWPPTGQGTYTMVSASYTLYPMPYGPDPRGLHTGLRWMGSVSSAHTDLLWEYGSDTAVTTGDIVIDNEAGVLWLKPQSSFAWYTERRANKVVVTCGFATTPPDVVLACALVVRHLIDLRRTQGRTSVTQGGQSQILTDQDSLIPRVAQDLLGPYVVWGSRAA